MIISHRHKFIFIKPKKVGGTSIEIALSKFCGGGDVLTPISTKDEAKREGLGFATARNYHKELSEYSFRQLWRRTFTLHKAKKFYNHMPASMIRDAVPEQVWEEYLKVSVVRSPYERAVSRYFWGQDGEAPAESFQSFLMANLDVLDENRRITHTDGVSAVDQWVQFEDMDAGLRELGARLGFGDELAELMRGIHAKKGVRPKKASAASLFEGFDEGLEKVQELCSEDLAEWGYELR